jgi:putative aldouronate transport system substrate-binding protein
MDSFPFYVDPNEEIIYLTEDGKAKAYFETEEFREAARIQHEMYTRGVRHPDLLSLPRDLRRQPLQNGKLLFGFGAGPSPGEIEIIKQTDPGIRIEISMLKPDDPYFQVLPVWNSNSVPATTDTPEVGIQFLNWLNSDEANHDLFLYGIEGVHYEGDSQANRRIDIKTTETGAPLYQHAVWQIGWIDWTNFSMSTSDAQMDINLKDTDNVINAPNVGFVFDKTAVSTEYANVLAEREASMYPIKWGVVSYEDGFDEAIARMRAAGLDRIVQEYQKQFDAWKAAQ